MRRPFEPRLRLSAAMLVAASVAIVALVGSVGPMSAAQAAPATMNNPKVIVGLHNSAIDVHGGLVYGAIAHIAIPGGQWFITAKGYLQSTPIASVSCQLVASSDTNTISTAYDSN